MGGSGYEQATSIEQTSEGGYIVVGLTTSNDGDVSGNHGSSDAWIVKLNSTGSIEWQKCLGGSGYEQATSIEQTSEGGYIVVGLTTSNDGDVSGNHEDAWVVKLNSTGSILWQKCLGEYDCAYLAFSIEQTSDNGYVVAGFRASNEAEEVSGILIKLDNSGSINWQMCFDKSGYDNILYSVKQTSDNGYIVAGASLNHEENFDFWLLKLD
ncbi:PKD (fragment) [Mesotoga infera]